MHSSVSPATVHGDRDPSERIEPLRSEVLTCRHRQDDGAKGEELSLLRAQEGLAFEERDDTSEEVLSVAHDQHEGAVS